MPFSWTRCCAWSRMLSPAKESRLSPYGDEKTGGMSVTWGFTGATQLTTHWITFLLHAVNTQQLSRIAKQHCWVVQRVRKWTNLQKEKNPRIMIISNRYKSVMMMIAFIIFKSSLVPLFEGLWSSNSWEFELSGFWRNRTDDLGTDSPSLWPNAPRLHVRSETNANRRPAGKTPLTPLLHTHAIVARTNVVSSHCQQTANRQRWSDDIFYLPWRSPVPCSWWVCVQIYIVSYISSATRRVLRAAMDHPVLEFVISLWWDFRKEASFWHWFRLNPEPIGLST